MLSSHGQRHCWRLEWLTAVHATTLRRMLHRACLASTRLTTSHLLQLVLQVLDENVKEGSTVYEKGHLLILGWLDNRKAEETIWKILSQVRPACLHMLSTVLLLLRSLTQSGGCCRCCRRSC